MVGDNGRAMGGAMSDPMGCEMGVQWGAMGCKMGVQWGGNGVQNGRAMEGAMGGCTAPPSLLPVPPQAP